MAAAILLAIAIAAVVYIVIGYPLLLRVLWPRKAPAVVKDFTYQPSVSVVMAVYNGAAMIRRKLDVLMALDYPRSLLEIIVVSDGSTDETDAIVREYERNPGVAPARLRLIRVPKGGKAAALNPALAAATGEIIFFTDVRQPIDPAALRHLTANFADPR